MIGRWTMVGAAALLAACGGSTASSSGSGSTATASGAATLSFGDALTRTETAHPDAKAFEVEYEEHGGRRVIEVEVLSGETVHAVFYDPASGEVVEEADETPEADEAASLPTVRAAIEAGSVSMRSALELANSHHPEGIEAVELQVENGAVVVAVLVRDASGMARYAHDPATGNELSRAAGAAEHAE
jgi:uncharacterized iron-regulated membrane protein